MIGARSAGAANLGDRYLAVLAVSLAGYAFLGRGFAYFGVPPLFIGEVMLAAGLVVLLRSGCSIALLSSLPVLLISILVLWTVSRTIPYVGLYRVDALRDSVLILYSAFGLIVAAALIERPERLNDLLRYYGRFAAAFGCTGGLAFFFSEHFGPMIPSWPISGVPMMYLRSGETSVHLSGAALFAVLGFRRSSPVWIAFLVLGAFVTCASSRGGMLSILVPVAAAVVLGGRTRKAIPALIVASGLFCIAYIVNFELPGTGKGERVPDVQQVVDNLLSVFVSGDDSLDNTKEWRLLWWSTIVEYTLHGDYFWQGKGFGINLAESDGFLGTPEPGQPLLRSPHNAHMSVLARAGVPGLALWILVALSWFVMMARNMFDARRRGEHSWADLFLFVSCYLSAIIIDSTFDVALEGPMLGIWFWVLFGVGVGASMIYRARLEPSLAMHLRPDIGMTAARGFAGIAVALLSFAVTTSAFAEDGPITAPAGWQVRHDLAGRAIENLSGSCLVLNGIRNTIIENIKIGPCGEYGIDITDSENVLIRNVTVRDTADTGIRILGSQSITVAESYLENTLSGVKAQSSGQIRIECNRFRDVRGPIPSGQFVQFNKVSGPGSEISCNDGRNTPGRGQPEDAISLYKSSGVPGAPIMVRNNLIIGGGPSESGGGIMLGDDGGADLVAMENILIDPGQYGIGVASGDRISVVGNVISGRSQPFTNVGIYVWNQYPHRCSAIEVAGNHVEWRNKDGSPNPWWDGGNCGPIAGVSSNLFSDMTPKSPAAALPASCTCADPGASIQEDGK